jgi:AraC-like DNA-binding protein
MDSMSETPNDSTLPIDANGLDEFLRTLSFRCKVFFRGQLCDSWSLDTAGSSHVNFHVVCHGEGWFRLPGWEEAQRLTQGDVVVLPSDACHQIASHADAPEAYGQTRIARQIELDRSQPGTALVCGYLTIDERAFRLLFAMLPPSVILRSSEVENVPLRSLVEMLFAEAQTQAIGASAVLDRLADALMFYLIRYVALHHRYVTGLVAALRDRPVRAALLAIFERPGGAWSIATLADASSLSRSAFSDRFQGVMGETPMAFLTSWRMQLARHWLQNDRLSVGEAAGRCGYASEAAFAKAFKREMGIGPGECRRMLLARAS